MRKKDLQQELRFLFLFCCRVELKVGGNAFASLLELTLGLEPYGLEI